MRIRFLSNQVYETAGPGNGPRFAKGYVLDGKDVAAALGLKYEPSPEWVEGFLNRWLQRGVAVDHDAVPEDPPAVEPEVVEQVEKTQLSKLTRAELDDLAGKRGIDVSPKRRPKQTSSRRSSWAKTPK
jgi:hypothetical protein